MVLVDQQPPADVALVAFGPVGEDAGPLGLVVVAVGDRAVTVDGWAQRRSDGAVTDDSTTLGTGPDGLLEWVAPGAGPYDVSVDGLPPRVLGEQTAQVPAVTWSGKGARVDDEVVRSGAQAAVAGLALTTAPAEQLWAGGDEPGSPVVVSVPAPSGAALLVVGRVAQPVPWRTVEHTDPPAMTVDLRAVLPGGEEPVVAWQVGETVWSHQQGTSDGWGDSDETWTRGRAPPRRSPSSARRPPCGPTSWAARGRCCARWRWPAGQGWPARTVRSG